MLTNLYYHINMDKEKITEKELLNDFSSIEKLTREWENLYPEFIFSKPSKEEDTLTPIIEPIFIYKIHSSC